MTAAAPVRERVLEQAALETAHAWAEACRVELEREGRRVEGGWPGTLKEARVRAGARANKVLSDRSMPALTHEELGRLACMTLGEARRSWRIVAQSAPRRPRDD